MAISTGPSCRNPTSLHKPYLSSFNPTRIPCKFERFLSSPSVIIPSSISCTLTRDSALQMEAKEGRSTVLQRPDSFGRFGKYGGKYVPETLMYALAELETAFWALAGDKKFQVCSFSDVFVVISCVSPPHFCHFKCSRFPSFLI